MEGSSVTINTTFRKSYNIFSINLVLITELVALLLLLSNPSIVTPVEATHRNAINSPNQSSNCPEKCTCKLNEDNSMTTDCTIENLSAPHNLISYKNNRKFRLMQKEVYLMDGTPVKSNEVECHKAAVWKCGHRFIRAHKFLDFIESQDSFEPKCALRTAFFACLKTSKTKYCHQNKSHHTKKFRKRLADTLWSTRACLLGAKQLK